jgi:hypothetical protein
MTQSRHACPTRRARTAYLAPVFVVGFLAPAFLGHGWVVNVVPSAVALAAMAVVGVRVLRMTDREFATGAHQA